MGKTDTYDLIIIGAGLGGLSLAIRRRSRGERVLLIEKNDYIGGKLAEVKWEGYRWDRGPSLFTLPHQIDELFALYDKNPKDYFDYVLMDHSCQYHYSDGTVFTLYKDAERRKTELSKHFDAQVVDRFESYLTASKQLYDRLASMFIDQPKFGFSNIFSAEFLKASPEFFKKQVRQSLHQFNAGSVGDKKLTQLLDRFSTYNGSNPYEMSGLYSNIASVEMDPGTFFPKKGMRSIVTSLQELAEEAGVEIRTGIQSIEVKKEGKDYLVSANHQEVKSEKVACGMDHVNFYKHVLKDESLAAKYGKQERSASALVFYWAVNKHFDQIGLHNIFFSDNYKKEFDQSFGEHQVPSAPTIYVHNSSVVCPEDAPEGCQNWFVMMNLPAGVEPTEDQVEILKRYVVQRLKDEHQIDVEKHIVFEDRWTKNSIEGITGAYRGSLYGASSNGKLAPFKRHPNKIGKYKNLYFCGGTVHPGGGIPLVVKSAKIVDALMEEA